MCSNVAKTYHGLEHVCHHQGNSIVVSWLITLLAMAIETLYRLRFLHRGHAPHPRSRRPLSAAGGATRQFSRQSGARVMLGSA
jgi:hypothetical protein